MYHPPCCAECVEVQFPFIDEDQLMQIRNHLGLGEVDADEPMDGA